jgi:hypothetical protein
MPLLLEVLRDPGGFGTKRSALRFKSRGLRCLNTLCSPRALAYRQTDTGRTWGIRPYVGRERVVLDDDRERDQQSCRAPLPKQCIVLRGVGRPWRESPTSTSLARRRRTAQPMSSAAPTRAAPREPCGVRTSRSPPSHDARSPVERHLGEGKLADRTARRISFLRSL